MTSPNILLFSGGGFDIERNHRSIQIGKLYRGGGGIRPSVLPDAENPGLFRVNSYLAVTATEHYFMQTCSQGIIIGSDKFLDNCF